MNRPPWLWYDCNVKFDNLQNLWKIQHRSCQRMMSHCSFTSAHPITVAHQKPPTTANSQQIFGDLARNDLQNKQETACMGWEWWPEYRYFTVICMSRFDHRCNGSPMKPCGMQEKEKLLMLDPKPNNSSIVWSWVFTSIWPENDWGSHVCSACWDLTRLSAHCSNITYWGSEMKSGGGIKILGWGGWGAN